MSRRRTAAAIVGVVVAAAAGYLAVRRARSPERNAPASPVPITSRADRTASLAKVGAKAGGSYAVHRARKVFASAERQRELDTQFEMRTAEQITEVLGNMKGALMKLGQLASFVDQGLPEHVREQLAELQHNAPPMSAELAAEVVTRELGAPPSEVFAEWDPVPLASASIGQVHRAITNDDRAVAVKVQYPGVDEAIRADLENVGMLGQVLPMLFQGLEPEPLVEELRARLSEELDYTIEAANQKLFVETYRDHPFIHVPGVVDELSTARVLTTELAEGARFSDIQSWSQDEKDLAAEAIYRFVFRSLYRLHAFNGDPHPGNYLFRPGGQVTFLDFGLVKHFSPDEVAIFQQMITAMVFDRDPAAFRVVIERAGLLRDADRFDDQTIEEYFGHFYDFVLEDKAVTITPEWSSSSVERFFDTTGPYGPIMKAANLPPPFVIIQRINLGLFAILGQLRATANFRRIAEELWPWIDAPPSTPMGEAERRWLESRSGTGGT